MLSKQTNKSEYFGWSKKLFPAWCWVLTECTDYIVMGWVQFVIVCQGGSTDAEGNTLFYCSTLPSNWSHGTAVRWCAEKIPGWFLVAQQLYIPLRLFSFFFSFFFFLFCPSMVCGRQDCGSCGGQWGLKGAGRAGEPRGAPKPNQNWKSKPNQTKLKPTKPN